MKKFFRRLHLYFVPHEHNNYRAKTLHINTLTTYLIMLMLVGFALGKAHRQASQVLGYATDITVNRLLELTNEKRSANGLPPLNLNDKLSAAAAGKAQNMFQNGYWAHYGPDGATPWQFILSTGYQYTYAGENLAKNFMFSGDVVDAWMNSDSHRHNLLRPEYTDVGFAIVNGVLSGEETTLVVQMFGTPQAQTVASASNPPPANQQQAQAPLPTKPPAILPTAVPPPIVQGFSASPAILAKYQSPPAYNIFPLFVNMNYIFIGIFLAALMLDFYLASKFHLVRASGKNLAHFIFVLFMVAGILIITKGAIL